MSPGADTYQSYKSQYCESCGQIVQATDGLDDVEEPAHRIDFLDALGGVEEVGESCAIEEDDCDRCGGQIVSRYYTVGDVPEPNTANEPREQDIVGRDPDEDALIELPDRGWVEAADVSWLKEGNDR